MTKYSIELNCHICNHGVDRNELIVTQLDQVTSDCRPWNSKLKIFVCRKCGTTQKCTDNKSLKDTFKAYVDYDIYSQSNGSDQISFDAQGNLKSSRSESIVELLCSHNLISKFGHLMDFGCGNGNFIRAFSEKFTSWSLLGVEQNNKYEDIISSIPNTKFSLNIIDQIFDKFDLISLIHVLEHIPHPAKFLNKIKSNLKKDGLILIEIPNLENSPFDILIADHLSHFNKKSLQYCLNSVNLEIVFLSDSVIDKELTIIAKASDNTNPRSDPEIFFESKNLLEINLEFITKLLFSSKREVNNIGIFGSSIAASWLAGQLGEKVQFFIDEDPQKIGNEHLGIPIISISAVPKGSTIILPFRQDVSSNIVHKFNPISNINFVRAI